MDGVIQTHLSKSHSKYKCLNKIRSTILEQLTKIKEFKHSMKK
mgnify:CR=1 FL=1|jgi:hypothetical protein